MRDRDPSRRGWPGRNPDRRWRNLIAAAGGMALAVQAWPRPAGSAPMTIDAQTKLAARALDFLPLETFGGSFLAVATDESRLYAMRGAWLEAYRVDDPSGPTLDGRVLVPGFGTTFPYVHLAARDGQVYVLLSTALTDQGSLTRCAVYDVRPGTGPQLSGEAMIDDVIFQAAAAPGRLFLVGAAGVHVLDVRDAARPVVLSLIANVGGIADGTGLAVDGKRLYMALVGGNSARSGRVLAYDVGDGRAPRLDAERDVYGWPHAIAVHRGMVLVWTTPWPPSLANDHLTLLSAEAPALDEVGQLDLGERYSLHDAFIVGRHAVALGVRVSATTRQTRFERVLTFDLDELPARVILVDSQDVALRGNEPAAVLANTLWLAAWFDGLRAMRVDPASGAVRSSVAVRTLGRPGGLATDVRHVFTADDDGELWVLDLSSTGSLGTVYGGPLTWPDGRTVGPSAGASLAVAADNVVVARGAAPYDDSGDVVIVDVSSPGQPVVTSIWEPDADPLVGPVGDPDIGLYGPVAEGDHLYVAHAAGVVDLDLRRLGGIVARRFIADPSCDFIRRLPESHSGCRGRGLAVDGVHLFSARGFDGVRAFAVGRDGVAELVESLPAANAQDVALTARAVLVADGGAGLRIFDRFAASTGALTELFDGRRIALSGDTAFVVGPALAGRDELDPLSEGGLPPLVPLGVWALDVSRPFRPSLRGHTVLAFMDYADAADARPHVLVQGDILVATVPDRGLVTNRLRDGRTLPAARLSLPIVQAAR